MALIFNRTEITFQIVRQRISSLWNRGVEKYTDFSNSPYYEAITPFSIAANKIVYLSNYFFENASPSPITKAIYQFIKAHPITNSIYDFITTQPIASTVNFLMMGSLFFETRNNITERKQAKLSGDKEKIIDTNMKAAFLASKYLYTPVTIRDFLNVFKMPTSSFFRLATHACEVVSLIFSTAEMIRIGFRLKSTAKLVESLKRTRYLAFMNAYTPSQPTPLELLTTKVLKSRVKVIKGKLKKEHRHSLLENLAYASNQAFMQAVCQATKSDPENIEKHLNIQSKKLNTVGGPSFLEKLASPKNQNKSNLSEAAELIKKRLNQKIKSDFFAIGNKGINLIPSSITLIAAFTSINPILLPVGAGISLVITVASLAHIIATEVQKKRFIHGMERLLPKLST